MITKVSQTMASINARLTEARDQKLENLSRQVLSMKNCNSVSVLVSQLQDAIQILNLQFLPKELKPVEAKEWLNHHPLIQFLAHKIRFVSITETEDENFVRVTRKVEDMARLED